MRNRNPWPPSLPVEKPLFALAAFVLAALLWSYFTPVDISVRARGAVRPEGQPVRIVAEVGGKVQRVYALEGAQVRQGDPLVQLDTRELVLKKEAVEKRLHFVELRLADLEGRVEDMKALAEQTNLQDVAEHHANRRRAELALEHARERFGRSAQLFKEGLISKQSHEEAQSALAHAEADERRVASISTELKRALSKARVSELAAEQVPLRADLASLYDQLEQYQLELDRLTTTSPVDGQITSLNAIHVGETIAPGTAIAALVPRAEPLVIETWLSASDRALVNEGQKVRLRTDAFPPTEYNAFDGVVASISPDARFSESMAGLFRVLVRPGPYSPEPQLGVTLQVHFITRQERLLWLLFHKIRKEFS